jgi:hypothetical protein
MFGGAYRCVWLLIFEIWCYAMRGNWFWSVLTWGIKERSILSISDWVLFCYLANSIDHRERLGQTPFGSRWSISSWYQICRVSHGDFSTEIYLLRSIRSSLFKDWQSYLLPEAICQDTGLFIWFCWEFCCRRWSSNTTVSIYFFLLEVW